MRLFVGMSMVIALAMIGLGLSSSGSSEPDPIDAGPTATPVAEVSASEVTPVPTRALSPESEDSEDEPTERNRELDEERCYYGDNTSETPVSGKLIVLDPGHGDEDLGTVNMDYGLNESDLVLSIAKLTRNVLMRNGADVCLTRTQDAYVELAERAEFANEQSGDVFLSIHLNSLPDPGSSYVMTMWANETKDREFAEVILDSLRTEMITPEWSSGEQNPMDREAYRLDFLDSNMLRNAEMPAVLAEATFLSATWEAQAFLNGINDGSRWREHQIADALYAGLEEYFSEVG